MEDSISPQPSSATSQLFTLAIRGLERMYDPQEGLFCHRLRKTPDGLVREGISQRYTIMTLLGLLRARAAGLQSHFDVEGTLDRLFQSTEWIDNIGDMGLLLWLCAATSRQRLKQFHTMFDLSGALAHYPDARRHLTMELSWFLTGLVAASKKDIIANLEPLANRTYQLVLQNQGQYGFFGHMAKWQSLAGIVRGRVGSFADQVYPIFAMAHFSQAFGNEEARDRALLCANAICGSQGPLGQWWWHYDSLTGRVAEHYPVYSVHQHAMAPMALLALEAASRVDFQKYIQSGLRWITGANELHQDMQARDVGVAWRCIHPPTSILTEIHGLIRKKPALGSLHVLYECRPYELGWLLYAFADQEWQLSGPSPVSHDGLRN